jgi:hypothetical protein
MEKSMVKCKICNKHEGWIEGVCHNCDFKQQVTAVLKHYIETKKALRSHPHSLAAFKSKDPNYAKLEEDYRQATRDIWEITDVEYNEDGFRDLLWQWRFSNVLARKCTWWMKTGNHTGVAAALMEDVDNYEKALVAACGLENIYESADESIRKHFPNLCSKTPANTTTTERGLWSIAVKKFRGIIGR